MEILNLYRIGSEGSIPFYITARQPIGDLNDWNEKLQRVWGSTQPGQKELTLVSKTPGYTHHVKPLMQGLDHTSEYCLIWQTMRAADLPVAPTLRRADDEVFMTDFARHGAVLYDKYAAECMRRQTRQPAAPTDEIFVQLDFGQIRYQADIISLQATKAHISIPYNDPFNLIVYPNGKWRLAIIDIGYTKIQSPTALGDNKYSIEDFFPRLEKLREGIRRHKTLFMVDVYEKIRTSFQSTHRLG